MPITVGKVIDALDVESVYLDEILQAVMAPLANPTEKRWFARTLLDCLSTSDLRAELEWRAGQTKVDPFAP
jgi:hypothetical protein